MDAKIVCGFARLNDSAFQTKVEFIEESIVGNATYPTPIPDLATVQTKINTYSTKLKAAGEGGKTAVAEKDEARADLEATMVRLSKYCELTATTLAELISSGFDVSGPPQPVVLGAIENFQVKEGLNPGELRLSLRGVRGAKAYLFQFSTTDPATGNVAWTIRSTTTCKCTLTGLSGGQRYWVRVVVLGSYAQEVYSDVLSRIAQ